MAIGLFDPRTVLRCTSLCLILLYMWLLAGHSSISDDGYDGFQYAVTHTKMRLKRMYLLMVYDFLRIWTHLIWIAIAIPYMVMFSTGLVLFSRIFNIYRYARPYFVYHYHWSYLPVVENIEFPEFDKRHPEDDLFMILSGTAIFIVAWHIGFTSPAIKRMFWRKLTSSNA